MARENKRFNENLFSQLRLKESIEAYLEPLNVRQVCEQLFIDAYDLERQGMLNASNNGIGPMDTYVLIQESTWQEFITVMDWSSGNWISLARPMVGREGLYDIDFWISRHNIDLEDLRHYEDLVVLNNDVEQLYIQDTKFQKPAPYGKENSKEIIRAMILGDIVPYM